MSDELAFLDATAQADLVRTGQMSPRELVEAAVRRIEAVNPELNAVIWPLFEKARGLAASPRLADGPFRGVPLLLKDLVCHSAGDPFAEGMRFLRDVGWVEEDDTYLAARYRAAGFVFVGKANTSELGLVPTAEPEAFGPTRNPWDTGRSTGGSSGGSAAAVAAGVVPVAHANDGGGSIRIPASECGLVGLKPSRARISLGPDFGDMLSGLIAEHVVSRSVRDSAAILDAVCGPIPGDPYSAPPPARPYREEVGAPPGRLRVGLLTDAPGGFVETHPDCVVAAEEAGRLLESLGHDVEESHPPPFLDREASRRFGALWFTGAAWQLDHWARRTGKPIGPEDVELSTWMAAERGRSPSAPEHLANVEWLQDWSRRLAAWWQSGFDLLLTPTIAEPPPPLGQFTGTQDNPMRGLIRGGQVAPFTGAFNASGQPAISLPLHWNDEGLPIGVQLAAAYGREDVLIQVASQLEEARPWASRRPPVHA